MPKIVRFHEVGGPEVLRIEEETPKQAGKGEVRIKVQAVGLNRAESMFIRGQYLEPPNFPAGVGYEAAGVVDAVGPDVDKSWVGKRVAIVPSFSMNHYTMLGEEVIAPAAALGEYPANLSPVEGAAVWMQYLTAYGALIAIAHLTKGDFVVIPAASSSVGIAAIEIAKVEGAISIATTRKCNKKAELLSLGAAHVIATEEEDIVARVKENKMLNRDSVLHLAERFHLAITIRPDGSIFGLPEDLATLRKLLVVNSGPRGRASDRTAKLGKSKRARRARLSLARCFDGQD